MTAPVQVHRFEPRGAALEVMHCRDAEVLLAGPAGTGKSRAALEKVHLMCLGTSNVRALIVRQTAVSLASSALKTYERDVAAAAITDGSVWYYGGSQREPAQYRYANGSSIAIGGMDRPTKVMSTEYDVIYAQEATELTLEGWEALNSRLRNGRLSFQQLLADCNPQHPTHWLKQRCESGSTTMLHSRHQDNPLYFDAAGRETEKGAAYMARLRALTGVRRLRLLDGIWAAAEGVIYDGFDERIHVVDALPTGWETWTSYWAIDFGYTHPFVWQEWVIDPDGRAYLYREIYRTKRLVEDHVRHIKRLVWTPSGHWIRPRPRRILADHDAEDRATFERHMGLKVTPANKVVSEGIQAVAGRFKLAGDGRPRAFLRKGATVERDQDQIDAGKPASTLEEMPAYVWNEDKDQPVKDMDDGCDTMRYMIAELDLRGVSNVRVPRRR
jgi:PBSX family phage terminase large subunit